MEAIVSNSYWKNSLLQGISSKSLKAGVIGLGTVGLPLAIEMAESGFDVTGIEIDPIRVQTLLSGRSYNGDVSSSDLSRLIESGRFRATNSFDSLARLDSISICVPTPLRKTGEPDLSFILGVIHEIIPRLRQGQLIILESTTYPGTMDELVSPFFQNAGFEIGRDVFLAYSPERDSPGDRKIRTKSIPRVVGGYSSDCAEVAVRFYSQFIHKIVPVSSLKVAEMVKLLENTFRSINIAMINEMAILCHRLEIDVWEVIEAAKTKPFGFMSFSPGPGIGGHCIPIDPAYLSWKAKLHGYEPRFIDLAGKINAAMPEFVLNRITQLLNDRQKSLSNSVILVVGITYKRDIADIRESPALEVANLLLNQGADLMFHDPLIQQVSIQGKHLNRVGLDVEILRKCDIIVILTDHTGVNYGRLVKYGRLIFDTRNAIKNIKAPHIIKL
jgi:UDP-N-acetyl-D-glucosamine dehydrogenase